MIEQKRNNYFEKKNGHQVIASFGFEETLWKKTRRSKKNEKTQLVIFWVLPSGKTEFAGRIAIHTKTDLIELDRLSQVEFHKNTWGEKINIGSSEMQMGSVGNDCRDYMLKGALQGLRPYNVLETAKKEGFYQNLPE